MPIDQNKQVLVEFKAKMTKAMAGLKKMNDRINRIGRSIKAAGAKMKAFGKMAGLALLAAGVGVKKLLNDMDKIIKTSRDLSISTKAWQTLSFAMEQLGISSDVTKKAIFNLQKNLGKAGRGEKIYAKALSDIGLSYKELSKHSPDEQFQMVIDALRDVKDPAMRAAIANDLLGRSAKDMGSAYEGGSKSIKELRKEAIKYGLVIDKDILKQSEKTNDALNLLWKSFKAGTSRIVGSSDAIEKFALSMAKFIAGLPAQITIFKQQWKNFTEGNGENPFIKLGEKLQSAVFDAIDDIIDWFNATLLLIDWEGLGSDMSTALSSAITGLADIFEKINFEGMGRALIKFLKGIKWIEVGKALFKGIKAAIQGLGAFIRGLVYEVFGITPGEATASSIQAFEGAIPGQQQAIERQKQKTPGFFSGTQAEIDAELAELEAKYAEHLQRIAALKARYAVETGLSYDNEMPGATASRSGKRKKKASSGIPEAQASSISDLTGIKDQNILSFIDENSSNSLQTLLDAYDMLISKGQNASGIKAEILKITQRQTEAYNQQQQVLKDNAAVTQEVLLDILDMNNINYEKLNEANQASLDKRLESLREALELEYISRDEAYKKQIEAHDLFEREKTRISEDQEKQRNSKSFSSGLLDIKQQQDFSKMSNQEKGKYFKTQLGLLAQHSKKAFEAQKALNIAEALINTFNGATAALKAGPYIGPILAGITLAAGLAQVSAIRAQQYNPSRRYGGPVKGGLPGLVGENGPEMFIPKTDGTIIPNEADGGGVGTTTNIYITAMDTQGIYDAVGRDPRLLAEIVEAGDRARGGVNRGGR